MYDKKQIGERIKNIRIKQGKTQDQFGRLFNASKGNVATWEKGLSLPNNERLKKISEIADIEVNTLLYGEKYTVESLKSLYKTDNQELFFSISNYVNDFFKTYYDIEKNIYFKLDKNNVTYFKKLFGRLENKFGEDNEIDILDKISSIIMNDLSETSIDKFDSRNEYIEILANYINSKEKFANDFLKYLIFICERISKNYSDIITFMLQRRVDYLIGEINDIVYDYDSEENKNDFYKIYNKITSNGAYVERNSIVSSISYNKYKEIIDQLNSLSSLIENIK